MNCKITSDNCLAEEILRKIFCCLLLATLALPAFAQELSPEPELLQRFGFDRRDGFQEGEDQRSEENLWTVDIGSSRGIRPCLVVGLSGLFKLVSIRANQVAAEVHFKFNNWSPDNFVFVPAIVYAGKQVWGWSRWNIPPYWYDKRIEMRQHADYRHRSSRHWEKQEQRQDNAFLNASTPLMASYSFGAEHLDAANPSKQQIWQLYSLTIEEYKKTEGGNIQYRFTLHAGEIAVIDGFIPSRDKGSIWRRAM